MTREEEKSNLHIKLLLRKSAKEGRREQVQAYYMPTIDSPTAVQSLRLGTSTRYI